MRARDERLRAMQQPRKFSMTRKAVNTRRYRAGRTGPQLAGARILELARIFASKSV